MSTCKQCGGTVLWRKERGHQQCFNPDGTVHWDLCSKRRWEQVKSTGQRFEDRKQLDGNIVSGYANSVHGTKLDRIKAAKRRGQRHKGPFHGEPPCNNCVPPWDKCPNGCPLEFGAIRAREATR